MNNQHIIKTDIVIIGAGPVGIFAAFQCGMAGLGCQIVDALDAPGGQCRALYPEKPIYDIPGFPEISAADLITKLLQQAAPFSPGYHFDQTVCGLEPLDGGRWLVTTSRQQIFDAGAVIIAAGVGAFEPKRPPLTGIDAYERLGPGLGVNYFLKQIDPYKNKCIVIAGSGETAIDWALALADQAKSIDLVHRRDSFRVSETKLAALKNRTEAGQIQLITPYQLSNLVGDETKLSAVDVKDLNGNSKQLKADVLLACFGLSQKLGPIIDWQLDIDKKRIPVDPTTAATNRPGIYAIGDIANYDHKQRLILTGFSEAAFAAEAAHRHIHPDTPLRFQHSTAKGLPSC